MKKIIYILFTLALVATLGLVQKIRVAEAGENHEETCYGECPTYKFETSRLVCPRGWNLDGEWCYKNDQDPVEAKKETFEAEVQYGIKSEDDNHCHRPTAESLDIPSWARSTFNREFKEILDREVVECPAPTRCEVLIDNLKDREFRDRWTKRCYENPENLAKCVSILRECEVNVCRVLPEHPRCQEPSVTPTPTPEPTPTPVEQRHEAGGAPQCPNNEPLVLPANVHVIRNGSDATVNFFVPEGNSANVYFKVNGSPDWQHSVRDIPVTGGYVSYTVHELDPNLGYTFAVQSLNSCAGGELVLSVVEDPPANGKLFMFSWFEWLK